MLLEWAITPEMAAAATHKKEGAGAASFMLSKISPSTVNGEGRH
jgi:hypothetical protein